MGSQGVQLWVGGGVAPKVIRVVWALFGKSPHWWDSIPGPGAVGSGETRVSLASGSLWGGGSNLVLAPELGQLRP